MRYTYLSPTLYLHFASLHQSAFTFFFFLSPFICFPAAGSVAESKMVRAALVTATSLALTGAVVAHAYFLKHQFYPTVVYLTKSSPSMAVRAMLKSNLEFGLNYQNIFPIVMSLNFTSFSVCFSGIRCCTFRPLCWCFCWESS